ncbi:MAG TPA: hypothetical protein PLQ35_15165 [bacterium]|nr:hypothetical protein [bacterium]HQL63623.1 hypothetical protein [bacterium]
MKRGTPDHPKVHDFADILQKKLQLPWELCLSLACGMLERFWHFTAKFAPAGDVGKFPNNRIARAIGWPDDPDWIVEALMTCGMLDRDDIHRLIVHDWAEHADDCVHAQIARKRQYFASGDKPKTYRLSREDREQAELFYKDPANVRQIPDNHPKGGHETPDEPPADTPPFPSPSIPCQSPSIPPEEKSSISGDEKPKNQSDSLSVDQEKQFEEFWKAYPPRGNPPAREGKAAAKKAWGKINPSRELARQIREAVEKKKACKQWKDPQYIPLAATWLNQRRWEDEPGEGAKSAGKRGESDWGNIEEEAFGEVDSKGKVIK